MYKPLNILILAIFIYWVFLHIFCNYFTGHVDPGESELQTALRETQEEAGLSEQMFNVFSEFKHTLNYQVKGKPKRVVYWLAELKDPNCPIVLSHEHQKFVWEPLERALEVSGYSDMQKLLKEADNVIKSRKTWHLLKILIVTSWFLLYSETCINQTSLELTCVFRIDRCLVNTGWINKNFLHLDIN